MDEPKIKSYEKAKMRSGFERDRFRFFIGMLLVFYITYLGQTIVLPLVFAILLAILLDPFVNYLTRRKMNRIISIFLVLIVALVVMGGLLSFVISQMTMFGEALPSLKEKSGLALKQFVEWSSRTFNMSAFRIDAWIDKVMNEEMSNSTAMIGQTVGKLLNILINAFLIPVYVFLILLYKQLLLTFIGKLFSYEKHRSVVDVLNESKVLIQKYLIGLLIEASIVAVLDSAVLLMIGIDYAILIGIICALLNFIPYIGGIVALFMTMAFALVTKSPAAAFMVMAGQFIVQVIDNNYLVPKVVGSRVRINALASIVVVLVGGELFGVAGMFLSIPITAIVKVICDKDERFQPLGLLLGDTMPPLGKSIFNVKRK